MAMIATVCAAAMVLVGQSGGGVDPNVLKNPNFKSGLDGWTSQGEIRADSAGQGADLLTDGSAIRQSYNVPGLRILTVNATLAISTHGYPADLRLQCFDANHRLLLNLDQPFGTKNETGIYLKTQAFTKSVTVSIERSGVSSEPVRVASVKLIDEDRDKAHHAPQVDLDQYMHPIWRGDTIVDETALMFSQHGGQPSGKLLFPPTQFLSVTDSTRKIHFQEGKDFEVKGNVIRALAGSKMPIVSDTEIPKGNYPWLSVAGRHVLVSYKHTSRWSGPLASYQGDRLPETLRKLKSKDHLTVVGFGDSITLGINTSGYRGEAPYMPTWADLFVRQLGKNFQNVGITFYNASLGGMTAEWGKENAKNLVADLNPDLVLIAFGMNDFWSYSSEQFRDNVQAIVTQIRATKPHCEFILVGSMKFDPAYTDDPNYVHKLADYADELRAMGKSGIAFLDMTTMSEALYAAKSAKDLATDPMHPDDFLARWYAQSLVALFDPTEKQPAPVVENRSARSFYLDPNGNDSGPGSAAKPWRTLDKLHQLNLIAGDHIVLASGARFQGNIRLHETDAGTPTHPIVIESVGKPATISSPGETGLTANRGGLVVRNLRFEGGATSKAGSKPGVLLSARGSSKLSFIRVQDVSIHGFSGDGLSIESPKGSKNGFENVIISHVKANGNFGTGIISGDGIAFESKGFAHHNFLITDCDVSDNFSGSGLILSGVENAVVQYCKSFRNLGAGGGVGMWAWCAQNVVFRYCVSSGTRTNNGGDGGGFDLDGGCSNCVVEHCLSFDNDGPGYMHCDFPTAPKTTGNVIRKSLSVNDGRKPKGDSIGFGFVTWGSGLDDCVIDGDYALVTSPDPKAKRNGVFFVSYITGSKAANDVLHVKECVVRNCVADVEAEGDAFLRSDLPNMTTSDVQFFNNLYYSTAQTPFIQSNSHEQIFSTAQAWSADTHQESGSTAEMTEPKLMQRRQILLANYKLVAPRALPALFQKVGI